MSNSRVIAVLATVAVLALGGYWLLAGEGNSDRTAIATPGSIGTAIDTVGSVQATGATIIRPPVPGVIEQLGVEVGGTVSAGDIIAVLDPEPFQRAVEDARRNLEDAEFGLQFAEQRAADQRDNPDLTGEVVAANRTVERALQALADAEEARRDAVIVAPRAGQVIDLPVRPGDPVAASQPVATIASETDLELIADVDELDLPNVQPGAEARFRLDAFPAEEITGRVVSTAAQARLQGGATVFGTTIAFEPPEGIDLRPGMNADVEIVTDAREDVLLIPVEALKTVGERVYVTAVSDDGREDREVILGRQGDGMVEVVSGLDSGDEVVLY